MLAEFIEYTREIFPNIDTKNYNGIKEYLKQFDTEKKYVWFSGIYDKDELLQGDIIESIPFTYYDSENNEQVMFAKGMILSNSCDLVRDKYIIIAPLIKCDKEHFDESTLNELRKNRFSGKMCLYSSELEDFYIDFTMSSSYLRATIVKLFESNRIKRLYSLSQFGFYFLCCKIAIYYLRSEDVDLMQSRLCNSSLV